MTKSGEEASADVDKNTFGSGKKKGFAFTHITGIKCCH
jgi:hypothetical protein